MVFVVVWVAVAILFCAEWYAVHTGRREFETLTKPMATLSVLGPATAYGLFDKPWGAVVLAAVALGALGDVLLLDDSTSRFAGGLGAFLAGHLAYIVAFVMMGSAFGWLAVAAIAVVASYTVGRRVLPTSWRRDGAGTGIAVGAYMAVIGVKVVLAGLTGSWIVTLGAVLFLFSDTALAINRFVAPVRRVGLVVMVTYLLGQLGLVVGSALVG